LGRRAGVDQFMEGVLLPFLQFLVILAVVITFAKLGGYLSLRLGQPAVAGEVLAGLILGPTVINFLHWPIFTDVHLEETLTFMAELGVLLLLFIAGLEVHFSDMLQSGRVAALAGLLGFLAPLGLGYLLAVLMGFASHQALFIGMLLAPTSVSISAQTLMEIGVLRGRVGVSLLGAAVIDDSLVVLGVSFLLAVLGGDQAGIGNVLALLLRMVMYIVGAFGLGYWLIPRLTRRVDRMPISQGLIAFAFTATIFFAWAAEALGGIATIIGAFIAGLLFARTEFKERILQGFSTFAYGIFVPIFFIDVGLAVNLRQLDSSSVWMLAAMLGTAVLSKLIGSGLGGLLGGLSARESLQLGFSMVPRGEVVLIVAAVGITEGFITQAELSVAVAMVILTTLLTPPLLRVLFSSAPEASRLVETEE
jgi:Kef-type K+ transport system membrane component KefB